MKMIKYFVAIAISLTLFSCTSSQYVQTSNVSTNQDEIQVYFASEKPTQDYEVIGFIETSGWIFTSNRALLNGLKKKAKKEGADGVINVNFDHIPHVLTGIPEVTGIAVKWKN